MKIQIMRFRQIALVIILSMMHGVSFTQFTKDDLKQLKGLTKGKNITWENDPNLQIFWIKSKPMTFTSGNFVCYFGIKKENGKFVKQPMRISVTYQGSGWVFMDKISFAFSHLEEGDDTLKIPTSITYTDKQVKRVVISGANVMEVSDISMYGDLFSFFRFLSLNNRLISITMEGDDGFRRGAVFGFRIALTLKPLYEVFEDM